MPTPPQITTKQLLKLARISPVEHLHSLARDVHEAVVKTDENQMGFTRTEVMKINECLWRYECAIHAYAKEHGGKESHALHKSIEDKIRKNVDRAFVMVKRQLDTCINDAQSS